MHLSPSNPGLSKALWIAVVSVGSVLFSLALACATPFVAIATVAGTRMSASGAFLLTGAAWAVNQLVGYLVLGYPTTWDSFAWGAMIGIAALLAVKSVIFVSDLVRSDLAATVCGFVAAFIVYEAALFVATTFLPSGDEAFSPAIVARIFWTNTLAMLLLLALHRLATLLGLPLSARHRERYA